MKKGAAPAELIATLDSSRPGCAKQPTNKGKGDATRAYSKMPPPQKKS